MNDEWSVSKTLSPQSSGLRDEAMDFECVVIATGRMVSYRTSGEQVPDVYGLMVCYHHVYCF